MGTHEIPVLDWIAQSPDLNPIENLWDHLNAKIWKRVPRPKSKDELIQFAQEEWADIDLETLWCLISSLPSA